MNKEDLDYEPFYYVQPLRLIEDPGESVMFFLKYMDEKMAFKDFLKNCSMEDFIWVIVFIFKDEYGSGARLSSFISETVSRVETDEGTEYKDIPSHRKDIKDIYFFYNQLDQFVSFSFQLDPPLATIHQVIAEVLKGKQYSIVDGKYLLESDSGIEYLEVSSSYFKLKANMNKAKNF